MVATDLKKLSKDDKKGMALSGKREETPNWLFVYQETMENVFFFNQDHRAAAPRSQQQHSASIRGCRMA